MGACSDFFENKFIDGIFRRGVKAYTPSEAGIIVGMMRYGQNSSSYGKVMVATSVSGTATCAGTEPTWAAIADPPNTTTDNGGANQIIWTVYQIGMYSPSMYLALFSVNPSDTGGGTETVGTNYARVAIHPAAATWRSTQGTTGLPSTGTNGTTDNANAISFNAAGSSWGTVSGVGIYDALTGGNLLYWADVTDQAVASGNTVTFNANSITIRVDD